MLLPVVHAEAMPPMGCVVTPSGGLCSALSGAGAGSLTGDGSAPNDGPIVATVRAQVSGTVPAPSQAEARVLVQEMHCSEISFKNAFGFSS